jgi:hypothetical protein
MARRGASTDVGNRPGLTVPRAPRKDLTHPPLEGLIDPFPNHTTMGQQLNKIIKRKRRAAYLKRKKAKALASKKK